MSYVDDNLMSGEVVIHQAQLHWGIFVLPAILLFIGVIIAAVSLGAAIGGGGGAVTGLLVLLLFVIPMILRVTTYLTTEFAVTSRRVIVKRGGLRLRTLELNHNRIESLSVNQGLFERIFNAGTIVVNGTGGTNQNVPFISSPMDFRRNALETIDSSV